MRRFVFVPQPGRATTPIIYFQPLCMALEGHSGPFPPVSAPFCADLRRISALRSAAARIEVLRRVGQLFGRSVVCGCAKQRRTGQDLSFY